MRLFNRLQLSEHFTKYVHTVSATGDARDHGWAWLSLQTDQTAAMDTPAGAEPCITDEAEAVSP